MEEGESGASRADLLAVAEQRVIEAQNALKAAEASGQDMTAAGIEHIGTHLELARDHAKLTGLAQFFYAALRADGDDNPPSPSPRSVAAILPFVFDDKSSLHLPSTHTKATEADHK